MRTNALMQTVENFRRWSVASSRPVKQQNSFTTESICPGLPRLYGMRRHKWAKSTSTHIATRRSSALCYHVEKYQGAWCHYGGWGEGFTETSVVLHVRVCVFCWICMRERRRCSVCCNPRCLSGGLTYGKLPELQGCWENLDGGNERGRQSLTWTSTCLAVANWTNDSNRWADKRAESSKWQKYF